MCQNSVLDAAQGINGRKDMYKYTLHNFCFTFIACSAVNVFSFPSSSLYFSHLDLQVKLAILGPCVLRTFKLWVFVVVV